MSRKDNFPGRPKRCENEPNSTACKKMRKNGSLLCRECRAVKV